MATANPFRAIIVGGGPVGLTAAHAFHQAGIDFILLENRDTCVPDFGASILINTGNMRVFHQLGLYEKLKSHGTPLTHFEVVTEKGKKYKDTDPFDVLEESLGDYMHMFHRRDLLATLYDNLPQEVKSSKIHLNKKVVDIETTTSSKGPSHGGVSVTCADGTSYQGTIVIGADGVYSKTRLAMRNLALATSSEEFPAAAAMKVNPEKPFTARYRCMWGTIPIPPGTKPGSALDCHTAQGYSIMSFIGDEKAWFFLYEMLPQEGEGGRRDYTARDREDYANRYRHLPVTNQLTFGDLWDTCITSGMSDLDEGVVPHWSHAGRVVLVGDAAHKVTPNAGRGFNAGIQDVAALTNRLRKLLLVSLSVSVQQKEEEKEEKWEKTTQLPTTDQLSSTFASYQADRMADVKANFAQSYGVTRQHARPPSWFEWDGYLYGFMEALGSIVPDFERIMLKYLAVPAMRKVFVLDWIQNGEPYKGSVSWLYPIKEKGA